MTDIKKERLSSLEKTFKIQSTLDNRAAVDGASAIILAVKPQTTEQALASVRGAISSSSIVVSIIAGWTMANLARHSGSSNIIRCMPNTPALIRQSMTVWAALPSVTPEHRKEAQAILASFGEEVFVDHEEYLDMATAISGTGPAYYLVCT